MLRKNSNPPAVPLFQRGKFEEEKVQLFTASTGEFRSIESEFPSLEKRGRGDLWSSLGTSSIFSQLPFDKGGKRGI
jgi:hypothetical protein